ncbi:MAG: hypothetical protein QXM43_09380, partial [Desulfurococcaceae archaeon]
MRVLTSLADYEHALNSIQSHSLRRVILNVLKERSNDVAFLSNAKCNLLAFEKNQAIRRKLFDLKNVLRFLEKITSEGSTHYALIKVQPFITHLWNDVDVLVSYKDVSKMINAVREYFGDVTAVGRPLRGGATLYIKRLSLRLDLYTMVGWRGLLAIKNSDSIDRIMFSYLIRDNLTCNGKSYEIQVLAPELDILIQLVHIYQSENANCNNFLEGYARILLRYLQLYALMGKDRNCYFIDTPNFLVPYTTKEVLDSLTTLKCIVLKSFSLSLMTPFLQDMVDYILKRIMKPKLTIYGWLPHPEYAITSATITYKSPAAVFIAYSRGYFCKLLISFRRLRSKYYSFFVLNPYWSGEVAGATFIKMLYPPIDPILLSLRDECCRTQVSDEDLITFRLMGRFDKSRGIMSTIHAFKRFKARNPHAKAKLIVDTFLEGSKGSRHLRMGENIEVIITDPFIEKRSPANLIEEALRKYAQSCYIVLPYRYRQFVEPPLTLMEALAMGSYVVITPLLKPFVNEKLVYVVDNENRSLETSLAEAFEYLYEIYGSKEYKLMREKASNYMEEVYKNVKKSFQKVLAT